MRLTLLHYVLFLSVGPLLLSGCGPSTVGQLTKSTKARQLTSEEILKLSKGNTLFLHGYKIDSYFYFDGSGYTFAKDIFNNTDAGRWDVSTEGELCFKMSDWWYGEIRCFPVYTDEAKYYLFNSAGVLEFSADRLEGDSKNLYHEISKVKKDFLLEQDRQKQPQQPTASVPVDETGTGANTPAPEISEKELHSTVKWMAKDCPDCNLQKANLSGADLVGAKLQGADLTGADLSKANLRRADLKKADLEHANLTYANLPGADLRESDLTGADLTGANLIRANLTGADIDGAIFTDALLEGVEGLSK